MSAPRATSSHLRSAGLAVLVCTACASMLGIDEEYSLQQGRGPIAGAGGTSAGGADAQAPSGGAASGGAAAGGRAAGGADTGGVAGAGSGGITPTGGVTGAGGEGPDAGDCPATCSAGQKCCGGSCVPRSPLWGCSATVCEPCTSLPDHAVGVCDGEACSFECIAQYEKTGDGKGCEPIETGSGGQSGTGGSAPVCEARACTGCRPPIYSPCCQFSGECGCAWPGAPCFPK